MSLSLRRFSANNNTRELAELLGQVKPPIATREEIEKSGLEVFKASLLQEYEANGKVASNCVDRVRPNHFNLNIS